MGLISFLASLGVAMNSIACAPAASSLVRPYHSVRVKSLTPRAYALDDSSSAIISYCKMVEGEHGEVLFSFLNEYENAIYIYDYESGRTHPSLCFNRLWPVQAYEMHMDTLLLFSYDRSEIVCRIGAESKSYSISNPVNAMKKFILPPYLLTRSPLIRIGENKAVMSLFSPGIAPGSLEKFRRAIRILDLESGQTKDFVPFPDESVDNNWGGGFHYMYPYFDVDSARRIVVSFSFSHYLSVFDLDSEEIERFWAGSGMIGRIKPFPGSRASVNQSMDTYRIVEWYMRNPSYEGVLYDKYRNCYYRIARLPLPEDEAIPASGNIKPVVVIVLDENFNYIGETQLSPDVPYNSFCSLVSPGGLMIQVQDKNEDRILFHEILFDY